MRFLVLFAHPVETSFSAALHRAVVEVLRSSGHDVDDCDLYAENFNPVMSRQERLDYHDLSLCTKPVQGYVDRLLAAEGLVIVNPVWNYGYPAILKGFLDRVFLPGVSFRLEGGSTRPNLWRIRRLAAVTTYGGTRFRAFLMGDAPRRQFKRTMRALVHPLARARYLALYDMNNATTARTTAFLERVRRTIATF
ncbi:MAG TPA: NAD(P)H-dependent oxidoreductase [Bauldia sp.]|nr:NAD(P)H-dependent oxidoreductase [Bauldia sp.]